jgi:hypothetical protein
MNLFKRTNARREEQAGLEPPKEKPEVKEPPKEKPKRIMSQAEFSGYAKGGVVTGGRGDGCASKGKTRGRMV